MWIMMEARRKGGVTKRGDKKKVERPNFFTVLEYKADLANAYKNSRIVQIRELFQL